MRRLRCLSLFCFLASIVQAQPSLREFTPPVAISTGPVIGEVVDGTRVFKGIPYAAPPVGENRWRPPQPPASWKEPLLATAFGPASPQDLTQTNAREPDSETAFYGPVGSLSEDCLYLNLWTPPPEKAEALPVFVLLHGGRLLQGSGSQPKYDGAALAGKGVVVVIANYRLGAFGFFAHPALTWESREKTSGNYGLHDALAVLRWVRENISLFGGDPNNVCLAGQAVPLALLAVPEAGGLFHRAVIDSAAMPEDLRSLASMEQLGVDTMARAGVAGSDLRQMREVSWQRLLQADIAAPGTYGSGVSNHLCIDGQLLKESPAAAFEAGRQNAVPLMIGMDHSEGTLFEYPFRSSTVEEFRELFRHVLGPYAREGLEFYKFDTTEQAREQFIRMQTDIVMATARRYARRMARKQPDTFLFQFRRTPKWTDWRKCFHGLDIAYLFGVLTPASDYDAIDRRVSTEMMDYWVRFMRAGNPNHPGATDWPRYEPETDPFFLIDDPMTVAPHLRQRALDLWDRWSSPPKTP